jgi:hypothetical protein
MSVVTTAHNRFTKFVTQKNQSLQSLPRGI